MKYWPTKPLADVCVRITDGSHRTPSFTETGFPFATVAHVDADGKIDFDACSRISTTDYKELKRNDCCPLPGDVLFSKDGTVGKVSVIDFDRDFTVLSSLAILRPNRELLHQRFLAYALKSEAVLSQAMHRKSGTAIRRIVLRDLRKVSLPVPPLGEQERIVKLLDEADKLRKLRAQTDRRTSALIPALFQEMFGDPASNPKGCPSILLGDVIHAAKDGPHVSPKYAEVGVPFLSARHIKPGRVIWEDLKFLSQEEAKIHWKKCKPEIGDVLYTKGGTTGVAAAITFAKPIAVWVHIALLKTNHAKVDPIWLESMLNSEFCYQQSQELTHGIANRDLGLTRMVKIRMYLPPLPLQKEFAQRVTEIRELETAQAAGRQRLEALFQSLLHCAFRGEL